MKRLYYLLIVLLCACGEDSPEGPLPTIEWEEVSRRFRIQTDEALSLIPILGNTDERTTYDWQMDGQTVGRERDYTFCTSTAGTYFISLTVSNAFGKTTDEVKVTVSPRNTEQIMPEIPAADTTFRVHFAQTAFYVSRGRSIRIAPALIENGEGASYRWTLDGNAAGEDAEYIFNAETEGTSVLELTGTRDTIVRTQRLHLEVCPPEGTYRRNITAESQAEVNRIHAYRPAPGCMVNGYKLVNLAFPKGCTHEEACDTVLVHMQRRWMTSLGGWGGYLIAGFDHSIANSGDYDLCIKGNPFSYQSEPGIIYVSQDENGDGQPNDTWYELAGSEYGTANHETGYAVTYYRPGQAASAIAWRDSKGQSDFIPYLSYWNPEPSYWQDWMEGDTYTFYGSRLASHHTYENGVGNLPAYAWGYADNEGSDYTDTPIGKAGLYKISNARNWRGEAANLSYIDFVKVQTAQTGYTPNIGEISTEVYYIGDYQLMK